MSNLEEVLINIINTCMDEANFPEKFKTSKVIPVHKNNYKNFAVKYRHVSLLPTISNIFLQFIYSNKAIFKHKSVTK